MLAYIKNLFNLSIDNKNTPYKLAGFVIIGWILCLTLVIVFIRSDHNNGWATRGQFGDLFGSINALFSGLAFAGIIYSIMQQQKELGLTRDDLALTREQLTLNREELTLTRKEFVEQNKTLKYQRFETAFYALLNSHHSLINNISHSIPSLEQTYKGREVMALVSKDLHSVLKIIDISDPVTIENIELCRTYYFKIKKRYESEINLFIESLLTVIELPGYSELIDDNLRYSYLKTVGAQLTMQERSIIYYYLCLERNQANQTHQHYHRIESSFNFFTLLNPTLYNDTHIGLLGWWKDIPEQD